MRQNFRLFFNLISDNSLTGKLSFALILLLFIFINNIQAFSFDQSELNGVWQLKQNKQKIAKKINSNIVSHFEIPESLIVAYAEKTAEITIIEGFKEFIQTQTLPTNGTVVTNDLQQFGKMLSSAFWLRGKLLINAENSRGIKLKETFELSSNHQQLYVSLEILDAGLNKPYKIKCTYQNLEMIETETTEQTDLTVYPFEKIICDFSKKERREVDTFHLFILLFGD